MFSLIFIILNCFSFDSLQGLNTHSMFSFKFIVLCVMKEDFIPNEQPHFWSERLSVFPLLNYNMLLG